MHRYLFGYVSLALAAMSCAVVLAVRAVESAVVHALEVVASPLKPLASMFHAPMLTTCEGAGVSSALYHRNRHEAGVSRRSAARNT